MDLDAYTADQLALLRRFKGLGEEQMIKELPVKQSKIIETMGTWPKRCSKEFLQCEELDVVFVHTNDEDDVNEPYYFFATPDERAIWPHGVPVCPHCAAGTGSKGSESKGYTSSPRSIEDMPFHGKKAIVVTMSRRFECKTCKKTFQAPLSEFSSLSPHYSNRQVRNICNKSMTKAPFEKVAEDLWVDEGTVRKYFAIEAERRAKEYKFYTPKHIGIDESKVHDGSKAGVFYVCIMDTGTDEPEHNGIIQLEEIPRNAENVLKLLEKFDDIHNIETVSMDMCLAYRNAVLEMNAISGSHMRIIVDRFHVVQSLNDKLKQTLNALYRSYKRELSKIISGSEPPEEAIEIPFEYLDDKEELDERVRDELDEEFHLDSIEEDSSSSDEYTSVAIAKEKLDILTHNYCYRWFVMNPESLQLKSRISFRRLLNAFPEFQNLYNMKEMLRYDFFHANDREEAMSIALKAREMLPSGAAYKPLRTFFKTLLGDDWGPHIFAYFDDPIGKRHSNAKLESLNRIIKEINNASRGLRFPELKKKLLYGGLSVKHRKKKKSIKEDCETLACFEKLYCEGLKPYSALPTGALKSVLREDFFEPHLKRLGLSGLSTEAQVQCVLKNNNLFGAILMIVEDNFESISDTSHDIEKNKVIMPLSFSDWEEHKAEYLAMVASDVEFLERNPL